MSGLSINMMGLLIASSVAGKKLKGQAKSRALMTSAILPATGIASVLTPLALTQKEISEQERRDAQLKLKTATTAAAAGKAGANLVLKAWVETLVSAADKSVPASVLKELALAFSNRPDIKLLVDGGLLKPIEADLPDGSKVPLGVSSEVALQAAGVNEAVKVVLSALLAVASHAQGGIVNRPPSDAPPAAVAT